VVEIGTGCGSSGIWLLRGMRPDGVLTSVDVEPECQRMARKAFAQAGFVANRYRLILGRALDVLPRLSDGAYDLVFCDADPREYPDYLEAALRLLRVGGIVAFDDVVIPPELAGLDAAEAVAGADAGLAVLRLVDCSLLVPPRAGPDGRTRYTMLETLRAYGAGLLAEAGEDGAAAATLAGYVTDWPRGTSPGCTHAPRRRPACGISTPRKPACATRSPGPWSMITPWRCGSRWLSPSGGSSGVA